MERSPVDRLRHDLRTPLIVLVAYAEMLAEDLAGEPTPEPDLIRELWAAFDAGHRVLATLDATPTPPGEGADQTDALRAAAASVLEPGLDDLDGRCRDLIERSQVSGLVAAVADERRMQEQVDVLRARLTEGRAVDLPARSPTPVRSPERAPTAPGHRVLVVDDEEVNRQMLSRQLERRGHHVACAVDGVQALELLRAGDFDLVLLDVMMPGTSGDDVLREIKADPAVAHLPVIMVSALDEIDTVVRCIELGAEDYLTKPFDPVLLQARVGAGLEKKRLRDAEIAYLSDVERLTAAAAEVESGELGEHTLDAVTERTDALGRLARVFAQMAREVRSREQALQSQVRQLRIEIDERRTARQVAEITETEYFRDLQRRVDSLRLRVERDR